MKIVRRELPVLWMLIKRHELPRYPRSPTLLMEPYQWRDRGLHRFHARSSISGLRLLMSSGMTRYYKFPVVLAQLQKSGQSNE